MTEIISTSYLRTDAVRFVCNALTYAHGSAEGFYVDPIVDELATLIGSYDTYGMDIQEFWNVVDKHEVDPEPETACLIESYRVVLRSVLDGSFRDMIVDDEDIETDDQARAYVNGFIGAGWNIVNVMGIASNVTVSI